MKKKELMIELLNQTDLTTVPILRLPNNEGIVIATRDPKLVEHLAKVVDNLKLKEGN